MTSVLTVVGTLFENIETKSKSDDKELISSTAAAALEVMHLQGHSVGIGDRGSGDHV
jgi:hypothetical protein